MGNMMTMGFFGRSGELELWKQILANPRGQAVLVVGQSGMGKTELIQKMAELARAHTDLQCGAVREEVTRSDTVGTILGLLIDRAYDAASVKAGSFDGNPRARKQWQALLNVFQIGDLVASLLRDRERNRREQFVELLERISGSIPEHGRAVFVIDPEKYLQPGSDEDWSIVVRRLPAKVKLVFAQRPDDALASSPHFRALTQGGSVVRIPHDELGCMDEAGYQLLLENSAPLVRRTVDELRRIADRYHRHPYAVTAAIRLLQVGTNPAELPPDPTGIAAEQLRRIQLGGATARNAEQAIRLFETYAILEVPVPDEAVEAVSSLRPTERKAVLADPYLGSLLRSEGGRRRIYHAILQEQITAQIDQRERNDYHRRGVAYFKYDLKQSIRSKTTPNGFVVSQLPEHVAKLEGHRASAIVINDLIVPALAAHNQWDQIIGVARLAATRVEGDQLVRACIAVNLADAFANREQFEEAEAEAQEALAAFTKLGDVARQGMAHRSLAQLRLAQHAHDHRKELLIDAEKSAAAAAACAQNANDGLLLMTSLAALVDISVRQGQFARSIGLLKQLIAMGANSGMFDVTPLEARIKTIEGRQIPPQRADAFPCETPPWSDPHHTCSVCGSYYIHPFAGCGTVIACHFTCPICGSWEFIEHYFGQGGR